MVAFAVRVSVGDGVVIFLGMRIVVVAAGATFRVGGVRATGKMLHRRRGAGDFRGEFRWESAWGGDCVPGKGFLNLTRSFLANLTATGNVDKPSGTHLLQLKAVMPETLLPALAIDDRNDDGLGEVVEGRFERKEFDEFLNVGRAIGLDDGNPPGHGGDRCQSVDQFLAGTTAHAASADGADRGGKIVEELGVHPGILVVVDNDVGVEALAAQGRKEFAEIGRFAGSEKTDEKDKRRHAMESAVDGCSPILLMLSIAEMKTQTEGWHAERFSDLKRLPLMKTDNQGVETLRGSHPVVTMVLFALIIIAVVAFGSHVSKQRSHERGDDASGFLVSPFSGR